MVHLNTIMAVKLEVDSYSAALALLSPVTATSTDKEPA